MPRDRRPLSCVVGFGLVSLLSSPAARAELRLGSEFQVNVYTTGLQRDPSVAVSANGDFIVVWDSPQDGFQGGILGRRFSSAGAPLGAEFLVNTYTVHSQFDPEIGMDGAGNFVVAWGAFNQDSAASAGVFARRFSSTGAGIATEFQVNTYTSNDQAFHSVAMGPDGNFVIAWTSNGQDYSIQGVFARQFSSTGMALAVEFQVNSYQTGPQALPSVTFDTQGGFVIAWQSGGQDGPDGGVFARRFQLPGPIGYEFQVNVYTTGDQTDPNIASEPDGGFLVVWTSSQQDGSSLGVFGRRFASDGTPLAKEFQVNEGTQSAQSGASVKTEVDGDFLVVWSSENIDGDLSRGVMARQFAAAGVPLASEFEVNTHTVDDQTGPAVAQGHDTFVVTWYSAGQDGDLDGVFAQRLTNTIVLDLDGNGVVEPLTDLLLGLRYSFGFRGSTLTTGAIGAGCTRCDAVSIEAYIATLLH